jgi:hypothetical protein
MGEDIDTHVLDLVDRKVGVGRDTGVTTAAGRPDVDDDHHLESAREGGRGRTCQSAPGPCARRRPGLHDEPRSPSSAASPASGRARQIRTGLGTKRLKSSAISRSELRSVGPVW